MRLILAAFVAGGSWLVVAGSGVIRVPLPTRGLLLGGVGLGVLGLSLGLAPSGAGLLTATPALGAALLERIRRRRRERAGTEGWVDLVGAVRGRLSAGEPLPDAVRSASRSSGGDFGALDCRWHGDFAGKLREIQDQWSDPTADRVLTTFRVAADAGGSHVDAVLVELAASLSHEIQVRRMHEAAVTQQQMTAAVALVAPWLILGLSFFTNPQVGEAFSAEPGERILVFGAVATVTGYLLSRRAAQLSRSPRVFR